MGTKILADTIFFTRVNKISNSESLKLTGLVNLLCHLVYIVLQLKIIHISCLSHILLLLLLLGRSVETVGPLDRQRVGLSAEQTPSSEHMSSGGASCATSGREEWDGATALRSLLFPEEMDELLDRRGRAIGKVVCKLCNKFKWRTKYLQSISVSSEHGLAGQPSHSEGPEDRRLIVFTSLPGDYSVIRICPHF